LPAKLTISKPPGMAGAARTRYPGNAMTQQSVEEIRRLLRDAILSWMIEIDVED